MKQALHKVNEYFLGEAKDITKSDYAWFYGAPLLAVLLALFAIFGGNDNPAEASTPKAQNVVIDTPYYGTNVGDGQTYSYIVTDIIVKDGETEIHGLPVTKASTGNRGIFLYESELDFEVSVGEFIHVVWGEEEDEFASITKGGMVCELTK